MTEITPNVARVVQRAELKGIRMVDGSFHTTIASMDDVGDSTLNLGRSASLLRREEGGAFLILVQFDTTVAESGSPTKPFFRARARFELRYQLPADLEVSDDDLKAFAELNGVFNAWPFWREFVQSTTVRMALPPLTLPLYRIQSPPKEEIPPAESEATAPPASTSDTVAGQENAG